MSYHYLIHLPHSGTFIPHKYRSDYLLQPQELEANVYEYCDLYTDELFGKLHETFGGVKSRYSRLFFDPERFADDEMEEMHRKYRLGWFYENAILEKKPLRRTMHKHEVKTFYDAHHRALNEMTAKKLSHHDRCTIIDCHAFSDRGYWFLEKSRDFPDICIGYEEAHVDHDLVETIKEVFKEYEIAINTPYAGSLVPGEYWQKDRRVKSVMIEINKRLYLQRDNRTKSEGFNAIRDKLTKLCEILVLKS